MPNPCMMNRLRKRSSWDEFLIESMSGLKQQRDIEDVVEDLSADKDTFSDNIFGQLYSVTRE